MTTSKDSQFLEVCKKPILTPLRSLIKTWISVGAFWTFPLIRSLHMGNTLEGHQELAKKTMN